MTMPATAVANGGQKAASRAPKMTLSSVTSGTQRAPVRALVYGVPKVGKSTWAAGAPKPIWLGLDSGTEHLNVARFPEPESFEDVLEALRTLGAESHDYKTLVVDPINWVEPLVWEFTCRKNGWKDIEAAGFGKGYVAAVDTWRIFVAALDRLRTKGMHVVLVGHSQLKTVKNPEGDDYDRYSLPINDKAQGLIVQWSDCILFAQHEIAAKKERGASKAKAFGTGVRLLRTLPSAAYEAGNRFSLPDPLVLDAPAFWSAVEAWGATAEEYRAKARVLATTLGGDAPERAEAAIKALGADVGRLIDLCNRIQTSITEKAEETSK